MSSALLKSGAKVRLKAKKRISLTSQVSREDVEKWEKIRDNRVVGTVLASESLGELDAYQIDFGDPALIEGYWWCMDEIEVMVTG